MAPYKTRLTNDLDGWIAGGLVPPTSREAILASVPDARRIDAATTLALVGAILLGLAVMAFIAANWAAIPRLVRFALLVALLLGSALGGALSARRGLPVMTNALLTLAALVFAASIGLTGQIFDLTGDPRTALYLAGAGAILLGLTGRSVGALAVGVVLVVLGDGTGGFDRGQLPVAFPLAVVGGWLAYRWGSRVLAHATCLACLISSVHIIGRLDAADLPPRLVSLGLAALFGAVGFAAHKRLTGPTVTVVVGWMALGLLCFAVAAGIGGLEAPLLIAHRLGWLALAVALIAWGRGQRHAVVAGIGSVGFLAAVGFILQDLGLDLLTAALVFAVSAALALAGGFVLRRRAL